MSEKGFLTGEENFRELIESNCYYIDKTLIIKELVTKKRAKVFLVTRPRRFGKSLTMFMLSEFFDITKKSNDIFANLAITKDRELCDQWMNKYPVIFFSLKDIKANTFDESLKKMRTLVAMVCMEHAYLMDSPKVADLLKDSLKALYKRVAEQSDLELALQTLCMALRQHWGKPVIVLIDEYDAPLAKIKKGHDYDELVSFIGNFMESGLKSSKALKFAMMTGCLRVAKGSVYTGLNHVSCCGVGDDLFADKFGFTPEEVHDLLCEMDLACKEEEIRTWYDGYCLGSNQKIYCPWDVMKYLSDLQDTPARKPQAYWLDTSSNDVVRTSIGRTDLHIGEEVAKLIQGGSIRTKINDSLTYEDLGSSEENIWTLFYMTGYLTKEAGSLSDKDRSIALRIPNKEIRKVFVSSIHSWLSDTFKSMDLSQFFASFWNGDEKILTESISKIILSSKICFDACKEDFYGGYLDCIFKAYSYKTILNIESGHGFADIIVKDKNKHRAAIIEIIHTKNIIELSGLPDLALKQIDDNKYDTLLTDEYNEYSTILHWGIAFCRKHCLAKCHVARRDPDADFLS